MSSKSIQERDIFIAKLTEKIIEVSNSLERRQLRLMGILTLFAVTLGIIFVCWARFFAMQGRQSSFSDLGAVFTGYIGIQGSLAVMRRYEKLTVYAMTVSSLPIITAALLILFSADWDSSVLMERFGWASGGVIIIESADFLARLQRLNRDVVLLHSLPSLLEMGQSEATKEAAIHETVRQLRQVYQSQKLTDVNLDLPDCPLRPQDKLPAVRK